MSKVLPTWPYILFAILEPISEILGWYFAFVNPQYVVASQHPQTTSPEPLSVGSQTVAYQLGNMYLLLALVGIAILSSTSEPQVVRNYFIALAIGDLGHLYMTYLGTGWAYFVDITKWNAMAWGNIGMTSFLFVNRLAYFLGIFDNPKTAQNRKKIR
ncbi:hypothetical protein VTO42DRAFT_1670 [Malbranchea cinnamomea]